MRTNKENKTKKFFYSYFDHISYQFQLVEQMRSFISILLKFISFKVIILKHFTIFLVYNHAVFIFHDLMLIDDFLANNKKIIIVQFFEFCLI